MDGNRPHGLYGEVYDRQTSAKSHRVTMPYIPFTKFESEIARIVLEELNKTLGI